MGYYIKAGDKFVGSWHKLRETKEWAKFYHHPSDCRDAIASLKRKQIQGPFEYYSWSSNELKERIE